MDKNEFKPAFKGCIVLPLTYQELNECIVHRAVRYYGDWINKLKRITGKTRKYHLQILLKSTSGEKDITKIRLIERESFSELSAYIYHFAKEELDKARENGIEVDLMDSYCTVKA